MNEHPALARFQAELLDALDRNRGNDDDSAERLRERVRRDPALAELAPWLDDWEPPMVALAAKLLARWGRVAINEEG